MTYEEFKAEVENRIMLAGYECKIDNFAMKEYYREGDTVEEIVLDYIDAHVNFQE